MHLAVNEFIDEQKKGLAELVKNLRASRVAAARAAARESAARVKSFNGRVRALARSGVRLTTVSQGAAQGLIELHAEIVDSALSEAAARIERMAYTESVRDLACQQADVLKAARQRIAADFTRAVGILKVAASDARKAVARGEVAAKAGPRRKPPARGKAKAKSPARAGGATRRTGRRASR